MNDCNCRHMCALCKKRVDRHTAVIAWGIIFFAAVIAIIFMSSCTPQQRFARLIKKHPELVDTTTRTVFKELVDSTKVKRPELSKTELDSLLKDYCNDTIINDTVYRNIYRDRIKDRIIDRCNLPRKETVFLDNGTIYITRDSGGTEYELKTTEKTIYQDRIVYLHGKPNGLVIPWWLLWTAAGLFVLAVIIALARPFIKLFNPLR